jgi:hypothetical protein
VDDDRVFLLPVAVHILHAEALGQLEVDLNRDQRVLFAVDVANLDVQLRPVEGGLAVAALVIRHQGRREFAHHVLRAFPVLFVADVFIRVVLVPGC